MNYQLDQQIPPGMLCNTNVLNINESTYLARLLGLCKFEGQPLPSIEYGYTYKNGKIITNNKIPQFIYNIGNIVKSKLGIKMRTINSCTITECVNEQYIHQRVDPIEYGNNILFLIIGMPVKFAMINLKNARAQFTRFLHNGTCVLLQSDSRFTWTYNTIPSMGKRWIIMFRHVGSKYIPSKKDIPK
jgi:hypothetical protein